MSKSLSRDQVRHQNRVRLLFKMFKRSVVHEVDHEEGEDPQSPFIERSDSSEGSRRIRLEFVLPHWSRILIPGFVSNNKFILVTLIIMSAVAILALRRLVSSDMVLLN